MKEKFPHCPICRTSDYVVLQNQGTQVGTAIGGLAGAGTSFAGAVKPAKKVLMAFFAAGKPSGTLASIILAVFTGFLTGATAGSAAGAQIDSKIRCRFKCNKCGRRIRG